MFIPCLLLASSLMAQYGASGTTSSTGTGQDQTSIAAPASSGLTGLFTTVTGNTLRQGDVSFSIYVQNWRLVAAPARAFARPSARGYKDYGYDHDELSASIGYGLTDRWELSAMIPFDKVR